MNVLFFGVLRELVAAERRQVNLMQGATARELVEMLRQGQANSVWERVALAVNREFASPERVLQEGDEVALLPPVSGGAR